MLYGWLKLYSDLLEKIFGSQYQEDKKKYEGLPYGCWHCEVLGMCRRPKEQGWKCYNGCMLEGGLPYGCIKCEYLKECRRPREQGWKCYNGCIKINMKREEEQEKEEIKREIREVFKINNRTK